MSIPCAHKSYVQDCPICAPREAERAQRRAETGLAGQQALADAIRAAVQADREETAAELERLIPSLDTPHDCASVEMVARAVRARGNVRLP